MTIRFRGGGNVECCARILLPVPAITVWGQLRDFARFASHDFFHAHIEIEGGIPKAGAKLGIAHRFLFFSAQRNGQILRWREGEGYAFSDLSLLGNQCGFPHVLAYRLEKISGDRCVLHIRLNGRWTAPVPRWMAWIWLRWVFGHLARSIENQLLWFAVVRRRMDLEAV